MRLPKRGAGGVVCCAPPPPSGESAQSGAMLRSPRRRHPTRLTPLSPTLAHLCAEQGVQDTAGIAAIDTTFLGTAAPSPPWRRWRLVELSATERAAPLYPSSLSYLLIL